MKYRILVFLLGLISLVAHEKKEKVLVITSSYNNAEFIEWQHKTFKKFLKDDYEFVVFNDASEDRHCKKIVNMCNKYGIQCYRVPPEIHNLPYLKREPVESFNHPTVRNCNVVQYALNTVGFKHDGIVVIFDSDLFLVRELSFNDKLGQDYDIFALQQCKGDSDKFIDYFWIGICAMNMNTMSNPTTINFNCGRIDDIPVDAGGYTHEYLKSEKPRVLYMALQSEPFIYCNLCNTKLMCPHSDEILGSTYYDAAQSRLIKNGLPSGDIFDKGNFFHYRGGTNWDCQSASYHKSKSALVRRYIQEILGETP